VVSSRRSRDSPLSAYCYIPPAPLERLPPRLVITNVNRLEESIGECAGAGEGSTTASVIFRVGRSMGHLSAA
jgi:hypothetical protein